MVLAYAHSAHEDWADLLPLTDELRKAVPSSLRAFELSVAAYRGLKRFDDWEKLAQERSDGSPDKLAYVDRLPEAAFRGKFAKTREIIQTKQRQRPGDGERPEPLRMVCPASPRSGRSGRD